MFSGLLSFFVVSGLAATAASASVAPDWSAGHPTPIDGWKNPYGLSASELEASIARGRRHALQYPVETTSTLVPLQPIRNFLELPEDNAFREFVRKILQSGSGFRSLNDLLDWVGMNPFPKPEDPAYSLLPEPFPGARETRLGFSVLERDGAEGFTIACAACHTSSLFGRTIIGLQNRFPRVNEFFSRGKKQTASTPSWLYATATRANRAEVALYEEQRENIQWMETRVPATLGLDTSLAQIALSLNRREPDAYATRSERAARKPRPDRLDSNPADSKPGTWWNVRFKNRWLLDGAVVSGNPILTNLLWNEIGHASDLHAVDAWISARPDVVQDLVNVVFHSEAPRYTEFFPPESISLERAKRGEKLFRANCASCHGNYDKAWAENGSERLPLEAQLRTVRVLYPEQTPVVDVGTDAYRRLGMTSLAEPLNRLELSQRHGIVVEPQPGYVPPPLIGIWARWPYFHNNMAPSLCAVLTRAQDRPKTYFAGPAMDPTRDFDAECNGYPTGERVPADWKKDADKKFDTRKAGLSNSGHDEGIFLRGGVEIFTTEDKRDLIQFLKTL